MSSIPAVGAPFPIASAKPTLPPRSRAKWVLWSCLTLLAAAITTVSVRAARGGSRSALHYQTVAVTRGSIAAQVSARGAVLFALVTVNVGSQVSGRIDSLGADFGSHVAKGRVIATIEPSFVTHEPDIAQYASRVIVVRDGRIVSDSRQIALVAADVSPRAA